MSTTLRFDEEASRRAEATYRTPDVVEQRRAIRAALALRQGENVLDIGAGPGLLACEMAAEVGAVGSVDGIDPSESMLALARGRRSPERTGEIRFVAGDACALPFAGETFDAAVATQVYEYVQDMPAALGEAFRVLRPGGRLLVLDTDWGSIVWHSRDAERMRRVLAAWAEHLVDPHLPPAADRAPVGSGLFDRAPRGDPAAERRLRSEQFQRRPDRLHHGVRCGPAGAERARCAGLGGRI